MKAFVTVLSLLATASAAPSYVAEAPLAAATAAHLPYAAGGVVAGGVVAAPGAFAAEGLVHEAVHAGPAVAKTYVEHGVVGSKTVQVGSRPVQVGHEYHVAGQTVEQPAPYSYVAGAPKSYSNTRPIAPPAIPDAPAPYAAIPPAPRNLGPAPLDTVTQERIIAPARAHTRITPRITRVEPELHVNKVPVEVRVDVPVPVHRDVVVTKNVQKPYPVEVPTPVEVPAPYKVHPVHEIVETPVVHKKTVTLRQPVQTVHVRKYVQELGTVAAASQVAVAPVGQVVAGQYAAGAAIPAAAPAFVAGQYATGAAIPAAAVPAAAAPVAHY